MIEQFNILNRFSGAIQVTAEIEVTPDMTPSTKLGLAVKWAVKSRANLTGAYLTGANLTDAYLTGAYLTDANLTDANLAGANLAGANLAGANLAGANLAGANLAGAYLADANLADAKWRNSVPLTRAPLQLYGLRWPVTILDAHMEIGCETHRLCEWEAFDNAAIAAMDGRDALKFWGAYKDVLLGMARGDGRDFSPADVAEVAA